MRFVIGLIFGGGLILLAAQQPDGRWLREAPAWLDRLADAAGNALAPPPRPPGEAVEGVDDRAARAGNGAAEVEAAARSAGVEPAQLPIPRPPDPPAPAAAHEDVQRLGILAQPGGANGADAEGLADAEPGATAEDASAPAVPATGGGDDAGRARVWVPFHSQRSADGFAERLSESLNHPFRVERQGPGRYQVVFGYAGEAERLALLDEAAAVTGLPL